MDSSSRTRDRTALPVHAPPVHGGLDAEEVRGFGLRPADVLDLSASINPLGAPPCVADALRGVELAAYPDPRCRELREALGRLLSVGVDRIVVGNGATQLIHLLARAVLRPGDAACILTPTFGEYEAACRLSEAKVTELSAGASPAFAWDIGQLSCRIREARPRLVFLCNPNNPTGVYLQRGEVESLADAAAPGLLVVDEAYISFVEGAWDSRGLLAAENVVLLRSLTKDYGLTGLRLGYAVASESVAAQLALYQPSWSVNSMAQAAGVAALTAPEHVARGRRCVAEAKEYLVRELNLLGLTVVPGAANFVLVEVEDATSFRRALLLRGVCVRDCTSFGLTGHIRVGVGDVADCRRLVEAVARVASS